MQATGVCYTCLKIVELLIFTFIKVLIFEMRFLKLKISVFFSDKNRNDCYTALSNGGVHFINLPWIEDLNVLLANGVLLNSNNIC